MYTIFKDVNTLFTTTFSYLQEDFELNRNHKAAIRKLKLLPVVDAQLKKIDLREALLDSGILGVITDWLTRLPDGSLPHLQIREKLLKFLVDVCVSLLPYFCVLNICFTVQY